MRWRKLLPCVLAGAAALSVPARAEDDQHAQLARSVAEDLAGSGHGVDLGRLEIEVRPEDWIAEDLRGQFATTLRPSYFEGVFQLYRALGALERPDARGLETSEDLVDLSARTMAGVLLAYYRIGENRLVFRDLTDDAVASVTSDRRTLVAHELVHAHQDQKRDLTEAFARAGTTIDGTMALSCMIEGEAEAVSLSLVIDLETVPIDSLSTDLEQVLAGPQISALYSAGRRFMVQRYREGGWEAVRAAIDAPPPSTEQILHEQKLGEDAPTAVALPEIGHPVVHDDVLGEMVVYQTLLALGHPVTVSRVAAAGWDGDRLRVHRTAEGETIVVWRTLWDREVDATQFVDVIGDAAAGDVRRRGRIVDVTWASTDALRTATAESLAAFGTSPEEDAADAASTAAVEAAWDKPSDAALDEEDGVWVHAASGTRVPIPDGWEVVELNGVEVLADPVGAMSGFASNVNVQRVPVPRGATIDDLVEQNRTQLAALQGIELLYMEKTKLGPTPAFHYEIRGAFGAGQPELHCRGVIFLQEGAQVVVTATTLASDWDDNAEIIARTMQGVRAKTQPAPETGEETR